MLTYMRLENFRAFREAEIHFAPLTVLIGANSTGKSSVLHALILLKQSLSGDEKVPLTFRGPLIDLGGAKDVAWQGQKQLGFHLKWGNGAGIQFQIEREPEERLSSLKEGFRYTWEGQDYALIEGEGIEIEIKPRYFSFVNLVFVVDAGKLGLKGVGDLQDLTSRLQQQAEALREVNATLYTFFENLRYIGPLRQSQREVIFLEERRPESVGPDARYLIPFLRYRSDVVQKLSQWFAERGLASRLEVKEVIPGSERWAAYLYEQEGGRPINLADTGFGYSQLIPVLAELYGAPEGSLVLVEQPELHLNPRLAVWIGDALISAIEQGKTVLVETHSEHIVLRLRRRIAEGMLSPKQVALYFVHREGGQSHLTRIDLDEMGQPVKDWPRDFWGEDYEEALHLAKAMARKFRSLRGGAEDEMDRD